MAQSSYYVIDGDTVQSLSIKFDMNEYYLRKVNGMSVHQDLYEGQVLKVKQIVR